MPNSLVHLKIGNNIAKKYKNLDNPQFYLGLITPDAVNLYGFAEKSKRWAAHIRAKDLDEWENNIIQFYNQNKENYENSYLVGYVVHVLTDIVFDRIYDEELLDMFHNMNVYEDEFGFYHQELRKYEASQIDKAWWKEVIEKLKLSKGITINSMEESQIDKWRDAKIEEYSAVNKLECGILGDKLITEALDKVEEILIKNNIV